MHHVRLSLAAVIALSGCSMHGSSAVERADAIIRDVAGRELGTLTLAPHMGGLMLSGRMQSLPPGTHGIHLHATGLCEPPFESAGGHWNPTSRRHGTQNPEGPHLGDMPNLVVASDGSATVSIMTPGGTLGGADALLDGDGAAVVVHAAADDYRTDPSGNSGARIACGVVRGSR
jgi:superoxide dismutase, Cu-Zn family